MAVGEPIRRRRTPFNTGWGRAGSAGPPMPMRTYVRAPTGHQRHGAPADRRRRERLRDRKDARNLSVNRPGLAEATVRAQGVGRRRSDVSALLAAEHADLLQRG